MGLLNFLSTNYVELLLISLLIFGVFFLKLQRKKKTIISYGVILISIIVMIVDSAINNPESKLELTTLFILMSTSVCLCSLIVSPIQWKYHLCLSIPAITLWILSIFYKNQSILPFCVVVCSIYYLYIMIYSICNLRNPDKKALSFVTFILSIINAFSMVIQLINPNGKPLISSVIIISTMIVLTVDYVKDYSRKKVQEEKKFQTQRTSIAISQIQPHFLYNALATIGYICKKDSVLASEAIDRFSDYLRANLNSIKQEKIVPFKEELKHVETYLWLEKLRFEDRLEIVYDIQYDNFFVPPLSIQPLVENAVKHGICEKLEGGTLTIRTIEYNEKIVIMIEDTGVGFDTKKKPNDNKTHVGIGNVRDRIVNMAGGTLDIRSTIGKGTISTITIPKRTKEE